MSGLRRGGFLTAILSDQTDWLDRLEARHHFFGHFDRVFNSYHLGKGKRRITSYNVCYTKLLRRTPTFRPCC